MPAHFGGIKLLRNCLFWPCFNKKFFYKKTLSHSLLWFGNVDNFTGFHWILNTHFYWFILLTVCCLLQKIPTYLISYLFSASDLWHVRFLQIWTVDRTVYKLTVVTIFRQTPFTNPTDKSDAKHKNPSFQTCVQSPLLTSGFMISVLRPYSGRVRPCRCGTRDVTRFHGDSLSTVYAFRRWWWWWWFQPCHLLCGPVGWSCRIGTWRSSRLRTQLVHRRWRTGNRQNCLVKPWWWRWWWQTVKHAAEKEEQETKSKMLNHSHSKSKEVILQW